MSHASLGDIHLGGVYSITTLALPTFFGNLSISGSIRSDGTMRKVKRVIAASQMKLHKNSIKIEKCYYCNYCNTFN